MIGIRKIGINTHIFGNRNKGLPTYIKRALVYLLAFNVADAEYPNKIGDQDRVAAGGEVFPGRGRAYDGLDQYTDYGDIGIAAKTLAFRIKLASTTEDVMTLNGTSNIDVTAGTLAANGLTAPTIYVDNVVSSTLDTEWRRVIITSETAFNLSTLELGRIVASYGEFYLHDIRAYVDVITASERASIQAFDSLEDEDFWDFLESVDTLESFDAGGGENHGTNHNHDSTSFVEGNWQSLMNKYGYAIDVNGAEIIDSDKGSFENGTDSYTTYPNNVVSEEVDVTAPVGTKVLKITFVDANTAYIYYPNLNGDACIAGRKYTNEMWYRANAGSSMFLRYSDGANVTDLVSATSMIRDNDWHFVEVTFEALVTASTVRTWGSLFGGTDILSIDGISYKPYYDTAIPPDMSTCVNGVPTHDIFGNILTFAGQAKYNAIARDRSCFIGDNVAYWESDYIPALADQDFEFECRVSVTDNTNHYSIGGDFNFADNSGHNFLISNGIARWYKGDGGSNSLVGSQDLLGFGYVTIKFTQLNNVRTVTVVGYETFSDAGTVNANLSGKELLVGSSWSGVSGNQEFKGDISYIKLTIVTIQANYQFIEGNGNTVHDVSPSGGNHLTGVNVDDSNWGVINKPDKDYLAEHGLNLGVHGFNTGYADLTDAITLSYDDAFDLQFKVKDFQGYVFGNTASGTIYIYIVNNTTITVRLDDTIAYTFSGATLLSGLHTIRITKPVSSNVITVTADGLAGTPSGSFLWSSGSFDLDLLFGRLVTASPGQGLLLSIEEDGVAKDMRIDNLISAITDDGAEQRIIPALSDKSADALGQTLVYPQGGKNLIPQTFISFLENIYELYQADQAERYEGGLMDE